MISVNVKPRKMLVMETRHYRICLSVVKKITWILFISAFIEEIGDPCSSNFVQSIYLLAPVILRLLSSFHPPTYTEEIKQDFFIQKNKKV